MSEFKTEKENIVKGQLLKDDPYTHNYMPSIGISISLSKIRDCVTYVYVSPCAECMSLFAHFKHLLEFVIVLTKYIL